MPGPRPCGNPLCQGSIPAGSDKEFCFNCNGDIYSDAAALIEDLDKVLRLEAEFRQWCLDHGQPDPHD